MAGNATDILERWTGTAPRTAVVPPSDPFAAILCPELQDVLEASAIAAAKRGEPPETQIVVFGGGSGRTIQAAPRPRSLLRSQWEEIFSTLGIERLIACGGTPVAETALSAARATGLATVFVPLTNRDLTVAPGLCDEVWADNSWARRLLSDAGYHEVIVLRQSPRAEAPETDPAAQAVCIPPVAPEHLDMLTASEVFVRLAEDLQGRLIWVLHPSADARLVSNLLGTAANGAVEIVLAEGIKEWEDSLRHSRTLLLPLAQPLRTAWARWAVLLEGRTCVISGIDSEDANTLLRESGARVLDGSPGVTELLEAVEEALAASGERRDSRSISRKPPETPVLSLTLERAAHAAANSYGEPAPEAVQQSSRGGNLLPLVSVIIPTRNRLHLLPEALASVIHQTFPNLEILVVNDGGEPIDGILQFFEDIEVSNGRRIRKLNLNQTAGAAAARNAGLEAAEGEVIAYLDDDDIFYPTHIASLLEAMLRSGATAAYSDYLVSKWRRDRRGNFRLVGKAVAANRSLSFSEILEADRIPASALLHEKAVLAETGGFDESLEAHSTWDLLIRIAAVGSLLHVPQQTCEVRTHEGEPSITKGPGSRERALRSRLRMRLKHLARLRCHPRIAQAWDREIAESVSKNLRGPRKTKRVLANDRLLIDTAAAVTAAVPAPGKPKVGFCTSVPPSHREAYRLAAPLEVLREQGSVDVRWAGRPGETDWEWIEASDLVIAEASFLGTPDGDRLIERARSNSLQLVVDLCEDPYEVREGTSAAARYGGSTARVLAGIDEATVLVASSDHLRRSLEAHTTTPVATIEETIDPGLFSADGSRMAWGSEMPAKIVMAYAGTPLSSEEIRPILLDLTEALKHNKAGLGLLLWGISLEEFRGHPQVAQVPVAVEDYSKFSLLLARLPVSFALLPVASTPLARSRSDRRWLEWSAAGVPCLCSRTPCYESVADGKTGWLVEEEPGAWSKAIARLLTEPDEVARVGGAAREWVTQERDLSQAASKWWSLMGWVLEGTRNRKQSAA